MSPRTYTCLCGVSHALAGSGTPWRPWGTSTWTSRWWHHCQDCARDNVVEGGRVVLSIHGGTRRAVPQEPTP